MIHVKVLLHHGVDTRDFLVYVWYPVKGTHKVFGGLDEISIMQSVLAGWFLVLWQISHGILILQDNKAWSLLQTFIFSSVFGYGKMKTRTGFFPLNMEELAATDLDLEDKKFPFLVYQRTESCVLCLFHNNGVHRECKHDAKSYGHRLRQFQRHNTMLVDCKQWAYLVV